MDAKPDSWKIHPLPEQRAALGLQATYSESDMARIRRGLIPDSMDDKWFICLDKDWLYFYRSWTGNCVYWLRLAPTASGAEVVESYVNRNPDQYRASNDDYDRRLLAWLIDTLLLDLNSPFPQERE